VPFQYGSEVGLCLPQTFPYFHFDSPVQLYLNTFAEFLLWPVMKVSDVILRVVIDHDASVEGVKP
jgi:hypothetical protein